MKGTRMKKRIIRMACLGILSAFLFGCGGEPVPSDGQSAENEKEDIVSRAESGQAKNESIELPEGYVLTAKFRDAGGEKEMRGTDMVGSSLYYMTIYYDRKQEKHIQNIYLQEMGKEAQQLDLPHERANVLNAMTVDEDENIYLLYRKEESGEHVSYTLQKRDKQQQEIYSVDATEDMEGISSVYEMKVGSDGMLYGLTIRGVVLCWDEEGVFQGRFTLPVDGTTANGVKICFGLANAGASGVYAYWGGRDQESLNSVHLYDLNKWREMNEEERKAAVPLRVDFASASDKIMAGNGDSLFVFSGYEEGLYLTDVNRLWRIDLTDGTLAALLTWQEVGVKAEYLKEIRRQEDGGFLLYIFDTLEEENYWVSLNPIPADQLPEKIELVLGIAGSNWTNRSLMSKVEQVVLSYNRTHPECRVTIKQYQESDITNFQLELLSGEGPDVLMERQSFFDIDTLIAKGAVEDLMPYLANGEEISDEDILPGILELITKDGKISRLPLSFSVDVMILPKDVQQEVWTPQEMAEFMAEGADSHIDYLVWPGSFLLQILFGAEIDHYIDEENGVSTFDSDEFVSLLERLDALGNMEMIRKRGERSELFHSGQLKAIVEELNCMEDYLCIRAAFSDVGEIAGFPNSSNELRYPAKLYDWLGMNSASKHKDKAWEFIEFCLAYTSRSDDVADRFTILKKKFDRQTQYDNNSSYFVAQNDYDENWEGWQDFPSTTQEETQLLQEIAEHLFYYENQNLRQIISEETAAYFAGDITPQEAAKRIQNRANLVLGE